MVIFVFWLGHVRRLLSFMQRSKKLWWDFIAQALNLSSEVEGNLRQYILWGILYGFYQQNCLQDIFIPGNFIK